MNLAPVQVEHAASPRRYEQAAFGLARAVRAAPNSRSGKKRLGHALLLPLAGRIEPMPDKDLDPVQWELVLADIAMEKARLKANGDWDKWEKFQAQTNAIFTPPVLRWLIGMSRALRGPAPSGD
jgi:hypothetical protein